MPTLSYRIFGFLHFAVNIMKENSIELMVSILTKTQNPTILKLILQILKSEPKVVDIIKNLLTPQIPSKDLHYLINIIQEFDYDFSKELISLYNFSTYANKIAIINYVQKFPNENNINWLVELLDEKEPQITEYVIDIITSLEIKSAIHKLIKLLNTKNIELKKRVCIALGVLKDVTAIPYLKKIVLATKKFFGLIPAEPQEIRLVACWSLGNFILIPEVKNLFIKLSNSKDTAISSAAKSILTKETKGA